VGIEEVLRYPSLAERGLGSVMSSPSWFLGGARTPNAYLAIWVSKNALHEKKMQYTNNFYNYNCKDMLK